MCSFFNKLFTATGNNSTIYSKNRIGNKRFHSKLPNNRVFPKWNRNSLDSANSGKLINH